MVVFALALALAENAVVANAATGTATYWASGENSTTGFRPEAKQPDSCIHPSLHALCSVLDSSNSQDTANLRRAADKVDIDAILKADESVVEDAHRILAIAACRVGVNTNPQALTPDRIAAGERDKYVTRIPYSIGLPLLKVSQQLHREPAIGYAGLVLDNCVRQTAHPGSSARRPSGADWLVQRTVTSKDDGAGGDVKRAEEGFYAGHCAVEEAFGYQTKPALDTAYHTAELVAQNKAPMEALAEKLRDAGFGIRQVRRGRAGHVPHPPANAVMSVCVWTADEGTTQEHAQLHRPIDVHFQAAALHQVWLQLRVWHRVPWPRC